MSDHDRDGTAVAYAFPIEEADPTGAGDCFGATVVTCRLQGRSMRGPMEGASSFAERDAVRAVHPHHGGGAA